MSSTAELSTPDAIVDQARAESPAAVASGLPLNVPAW
jgi:hypothetical protein